MFKKDLLIHINLLTMISASLFCSEKSLPLRIYEYMDDWEKFNETLLLEKEDFYSHLKTKGITDADYTQAKRICKDFKIKNLGE